MDENCIKSIVYNGFWYGLLGGDTTIEKIWNIK